MLVHTLKSIFTWPSIINFQPIAKIPGILTHPSSSRMTKKSSEVNSLEELAWRSLWWLLPCCRDLNMDFRSDFRSYIKKKSYCKATYALEFYFLSTVGSVYGVFSHFSLFIYYDDNDNDDNFCLLQMKMNKEAVRFSSLERISFLGGRVVKTPCECIFWISFMYISSLAVEMNNTYIVLRLSFFVCLFPKTNLNYACWAC